MRGLGATFVKFVTFAVVMTVLTAGLFFVFSQHRTGSTATYSAVFADASQLRSGDSVRMAGIRVGTVDDVSLMPDNTVVVAFDADQTLALTTGAKAAIRYLNLVGDRYLELIDAPGSMRIMPTGAQIPVERTEPALDLDVLLGGLKPVIQGLNPHDVNALTSSLLQIFQDQGGTVESLFARTSSFSNALADNGTIIQQLIDNLNTVVATLSRDGDKFSSAIDKLEQLVTGLAGDRDPIGEAIDSLNAGTASVAELLTNARPPLNGVVDELNRLAPLLDSDKGRLDGQIQKLPNDYRKLVRLGSYGSFLNYYLCGFSLRVSDLQGRTALFPFVRQEGGRCAEPDA